MTRLIIEMTEAQLSEQIRITCQQLGLLAYHTHNSYRSTPGFPDWVIVGHAVIYRELKTQTGKVTEAQATWLNRLHNAGQDASVWRPQHWMSGKITEELIGLTNPKR